MNSSTLGNRKHFPITQNTDSGRGKFDKFDPKKFKNKNFHIPKAP